MAHVVFDLLAFAFGVLGVLGGVEGEACNLMSKTLNQACGTKLLPAFPLQGSIK